MRPSEHHFDAAADAPIEHVEIRFQYLPAVADEGPSHSSGGTPGQPASVEWIDVSVKVGGIWHHDTPVWLAQAIFEQHEDDLLDHARDEQQHIAEYRNRRAA